MSDSIRHRIIAAIADTDDPNLKTVLLLMLGVLEEIGGRLDALRADEAGLRAAVLNGHTEVHEAHHDWVARKMAEEASDQDSRRKIRDGIIQNILWALISAAATAWLLKR